MKKNAILTVSGLCFFIFSSACSSSFKHSLDFAPTEPLRVAVLPVMHLTEEGEVEEQYSDALVDHVVVLSKKLEDCPATVVQNFIQNEISQSGLDLIAPPYIDAQLFHYGYAKNNTIDIQKIYNTGPKALCQLLTCDAVLFTKLLEWDRAYYGLQAVTSFKFETQLVRASDGKVIFESSAEDYDTRGLSKVPTGWSSLVLEPLKGLDNEILIQLAEKTVSEAFRPLRVDQRAEYLNAPPPLIVGAVHDSQNGKINHKDVLKVLVLGSPQTDAWFSIGNSISGVPLVEVNPGRYVGEYHPLDTDTIKNAPVQVSLRDKSGRLSTRELRVPISLK